MSERPADIRIDDLAAPVLTPMQKAVIEGASAIPVVLSEDAVLTAARQRAGLSDFGAEDFRERLRVWLAAAEEDDNLGPLGRATVFGDCVRYACNRLRLEDLLRRHPEILEVEISRPIVIAGLPRSGTTHLLNLISADRRLRSLPYWESIEPIPAPAEQAASARVAGIGEAPSPSQGSAGREGAAGSCEPGATRASFGLARDAHEAESESATVEDDPRLVRCRNMSAMQDALLPHLRAMHFMTPEHVHEEIELQALDFSSYLPEWIAHVPRWRDYYLSIDQRPHYAYMKKALQALQWLRGPDRWVLKSPQHLEQLGPLRDTFPDATFVLTHRDPVSVIQSAITMLAYGDRVRCKRADPGRTAAYWIDRIERMLRACVRDRALLPEAQSIDVLFHEFMADDIAMVGRIYELAGLPMTRSARDAFDAFMAANPRGKYGRVVYDLRGDFGIEPDQLRRRFDFYFERFAVRPE